MNRKLIIVGTIAILAFGATYIFLGSAPNSAPSPSAAAPPKIDVEQVLVAAQDLPMGTVVNDSGDGLAGVAESRRLGIHDHQVGKAGCARGCDRGSMTRVAFIRGEPIRHDKLVKAGAGGFMSAILPTGKRAVAIKIDNGGDSSAGGFILPNDRVDVVRLARDEDATKARGVEVMTAQTDSRQCPRPGDRPERGRAERQKGHHRGQRDARTRSGSGQSDHPRPASREFEFFISLSAASSIAADQPGPLSTPMAQGRPA